MVFHLFYDRACLLAQGACFIWRASFAREFYQIGAREKLPEACRVGVDRRCCSDELLRRLRAMHSFDARSEINANPKDLKNYPKGVWTLPPTLREGDADRDKYLDIGESDRMTLRFVKPAESP